MEGQLKFFTVLSLKEITLRRVAAHLFSDPYILSSFSKLDAGKINTEECETVWRRTIERKVKNKVPKLGLPVGLIKELIEAVRPIGLEIKRWKDFQEGFLGDEEKVSLPDSVKLFWTSAGTIDSRKTAEGLVLCDGVDVDRRYRLACLNCLEDDIPLIWEELPEDIKRGYLAVGKQTIELTKFWPHIIRGDLSEVDRLLRPLNGNRTSFNLWAFEQAAVAGNQTATKFFFQKLTSDERKASLMGTVTAILENRDTIISKHLLSFRDENLSHVLCYLLTLLTAEQLLETIKEYPEGVLMAFYSCPCRDLFYENAALLWTFVPESSYSVVLVKLFLRFKESSLYIPRLLRELFKQSPTNFKRDCLDHTKSLIPDFPIGQVFFSNVVCSFFRSNDSESLEVIFGSMDAADRAKLVFLPDVATIFFCGISMMRWQLVEMCLRKAELSREDKELMKKLFEKFLEVRGTGEREEHKFERCFEFLDGNVATADTKRKAPKT